MSNRQLLASRAEPGLTDWVYSGARFNLCGPIPRSALH